MNNTKLINMFKNINTNNQREVLVLYTFVCMLLSAAPLSAMLRNGVRNAAFRNSSISLTFSAEVGNFEDVIARLERGEDINRQDKDGFTALSLACEHGHKDIALYLLDHGADPSIRTEFIVGTPLHSAIQEGMPEVCEALLKRVCFMQIEKELTKPVVKDAAKRLLQLLLYLKQLPKEVCFKIIGHSEEYTQFLLSLRSSTKEKIDLVCNILGEEHVIGRMCRSSMPALRTYLGFMKDMVRAPAPEYAQDLQQKLLKLPVSDDSERDELIKIRSHIVDLVSPDAVEGNLPKLIKGWLARTLKK